MVAGGELKHRSEDLSEAEVSTLSDGEFIRQRGIRINRVDLPDANSVWVPMVTDCVVCQRPMSPSIKYYTCGKACSEFYKDFYIGQYMKRDEYRLWRWMFNRSAVRRRKCRKYSHKYQTSEKGRQTHREYMRNLRMWEQVQLDK